MERALSLPSGQIRYRLKVSRRAKLMRLSISPESGLVATLPLGFDSGRLEKFLKQKAAWILRKLKLVAKYKKRPRLKASAGEYKSLKFQALALAKEKVNYWNRFYNFNYNRISIKNAKTRWGSCSKKGNLNFHYKIVELPEPLLDYLIVHELCHLKEFNHSAGFWELVGKAAPGYNELRKGLRKIKIT